MTWRVTAASSAACPNHWPSLRHTRGGGVSCSSCPSPNRIGVPLHFDRNLPCRAEDMLLHRRRVLPGGEGCMELPGEETLWVRGVVLPVGGVQVGRSRAGRATGWVQPGPSENCTRSRPTRRAGPAVRSDPLAARARRWSPGRCSAQNGPMASYCVRKAPPHSITR